VNDRRLHFGPGSGTHADLEIHWTNGLIERFLGIESNQLVTIREGQGIHKSALPGMKRGTNAGE
jgi:enediyne biosynthesis protein E4